MSKAKEAVRKYEIANKELNLTPKKDLLIQISELDGGEYVDSFDGDVIEFNDGTEVLIDLLTEEISTRKTL